MSEPLDLDAIRARADAATPGPWVAEAYVYGDPEDGYGPPQDWQIKTAGWTKHAGSVIVSHQPYEGGGVNEEADAEFIAHARQDVPDLLAELARLRAANAELQAENMALRGEANLSEILLDRAEAELSERSPR